MWAYILIFYFKLFLEGVYVEGGQREREGDKERGGWAKLRAGSQEFNAVPPSRLL